VPAATDDLAAALVGIVGPAHVLVEPGMRAGYEVDWTGSHGGPSRAVVRPGSTAEVAAVLEACDRAGAAVVPQGGNTGLVGGGVPAGGEVVLSLRRLTSVGPVDPLAAQVTAGAGVVLADLQRVLVPAGLELGVDLAARDGATIGGLVATNAGGLRVLRHGTMRSQVVGVEAVLADGRVLSRLAGLAKDAPATTSAGCSSAARAPSPSSPPPASASSGAGPTASPRCWRSRRSPTRWPSPSRCATSWTTSTPPSS
jgi:FAD/FMN-containing dehydrogenase